MSTVPWQTLDTYDPEVAKLIRAEWRRQEEGLELIASENFASPQVIATMGSVLTNKYAEGLPAKRYYGGCEIVDQVEQLAIARVCKLFKAEFANVQPHSGAQANAAAYHALIKPGDRILGMDLSHGGHLTHGSKVNFSGVYFDSHFYATNADGVIDYDLVREAALRVRPRIIVAGASAYARVIDFAKFREIADEVGALLMVDMAHIAGLVAAGIHPSPLPYADVVTSTTHKTLRGPRGGIILWNRAEHTAALNKAVFPGIQGGPLEHIIAAKAVCFREADSANFIAYQQQVVSNAKTLAELLIGNGFKLVSGGTDNHLILLDLTSMGISGKDFEIALGKVAITVNKNTVPGETRSPFVTSGVRIGTPAITTRGMGMAEMAVIAGFFRKVFDNLENETALGLIRNEVMALAKRFPLYAEWRT